MQKLTDLYQQLLGFPAISKVNDVNLSVSGLKKEVYLKFNGKDGVCPERGVGVTRSLTSHRHSSGGILIPCGRRLFWVLKIGSNRFCWRRIFVIA
jgi:hypothetical protein